MLLVSRLRLSNQKEIQLRVANESDASKLWNLKRLLHSETEFLRLSPEEKNKTVEDETRLIEGKLSNRVVVFVAYFEKELIGYLFAQVEDKIITKVTLGVLQKYSRMGIGKALIKNMEHFAITFGITRIEMRVMQHNISAINLYMNFGYRVINQDSYTLYESNKVVHDYTLVKEI